MYKNVDAPLVILWTHCPFAMTRPKQTKKTIIGDQRWKKKKREGTWNVIWYHTMALRLGELPRLTAVWRVLQRSVLFLWQHAPNTKSYFSYGVSGLISKYIMYSWSGLFKVETNNIGIWSWKNHLSKLPCKMKRHVNLRIG